MELTTPALFLRRQLWHKVTCATLNGDLPDKIDRIAAEATDFWFRSLEHPQGARAVANSGVPWD